jgi:hypothetical protein
MTSSTNYTAWRGVKWGENGDTAVPGDYDGDGKTDLAVYRPSTGVWYFMTSSTNYASWMGVKWGENGDVPIPKEPR